MHYYKKNIGDYAKKAGRLTMLQHGAYTLLLDSCYDREIFPTLDEAIEWTWASCKEEIEAVEFVLKKFFVLQNGKYVQNRISEELEKYHANADTNKRIAIAREAKRKENSTKRAQAVDEPTPNHKPITNNQHIFISPPDGEPEQKADKKLPGCDHKSVVELYHQLLPTMRRVEVWNDTRAGYLRQRWREVAVELSETKEINHADVLTWWEEFFKHVSKSKFLTGKINDKSGRTFVADLEWIIKPSNFAKIVEGKYHVA